MHVSKLVSDLIMLGSLGYLGIKLEVNRGFGRENRVWVCSVLNSGIWVCLLVFSVMIPSFDRIKYKFKNLDLDKFKTNFASYFLWHIKCGFEFKINKRFKKIEW